MFKLQIYLALGLIISAVFAQTDLSKKLARIENLRDPFAAEQISGSNKNTFINNSADNLYLYSLKYLDSGSALKILKEIYPDISVSAEPESKQLLIKTSAARYAVLANKLKQLDVKLDQILIEVKVIEINKNNLEKLGINWDFQQGLSMNEHSRTADFIKNLELLIGNGSAKIMAKPRIAALLGKEAVIHIGDQVPYTVPVESTTKTTWQVNYLSAGIDLYILPKKAEDGYVELILKPEVASIKQWKSTPAGDYPIISSRKVETFLRLKENESFVIGGLLNEEERENSNKVPILGDIPLLNIFFVNKSFEKINSDVIFLVTASRQ